MKKRTLVIAALAAALISTAGIGSAYAYFTTYAQAQGGYTLSLGDRTQISEEFSSWTKRVVITSEEDSEPVYVRARAFGPSNYALVYSGEGWTAQPDENGWFYYTSPVNGGESTRELQVEIKDVPKSEAEGLKDGDSFNVVVVYESTPVRYDEGGNAIPNGSGYVGWEKEYILDSGQTEGGGN